MSTAAWEAGQPKPASVNWADIEAIESGADALIRFGDTQTALALYALALRLRSETGIHPNRRFDDVKP